MESKTEFKTIYLRCDCASEVVTFDHDVDEEYEDTVYMSVYKSYDHEQTWGDRLKDIWKILWGKPVLGHYFTLSKEELQDKIMKL